MRVSGKRTAVGRAIDEIEEGGNMKKVIGLLVLAILVMGAREASAASCWVVTGWSSPNWVGAQAIVSPADCTTVPTTHGWTQVTMSYGTPPTDDLWLRISLTDSRVSSGVFSPLLIFSHYSGTTPVVQTDALLCGGCGNQTPLLHWPPVQGTPAAGSQVRLRHANSNKCMTTSSTNGTKTDSAACTNAASFTFVLDSAGSGYYRLRNQSTSQCLYALNNNGSFLWHWGCWADPGMRFALDAATGGYRLRNVSTSQCAYDLWDGVHNWVCWADPAMTYKVDIIQY